MVKMANFDVMGILPQLKTFMEEKLNTRHPALCGERRNTKQETLVFSLSVSLSASACHWERTPASAETS